MAKEKAASGGDKRRRLTKAALELAYRQGFQASSIAEIAEEASVPLGNVYYYFKTKDDFGDAIIAERLGEFAQLRSRLDPLENPKDRLRGLMDMTLNNRDIVARRGCPFGSLSAEFLKLGGELAEQSRPLLAEPLRWIETQFKQIGKGPESFSLAVHLQSALRGVSLLAQCLGDPKLIEVEVARLKQWLAKL